MDYFAVIMSLLFVITLLLINLFEGYRKKLLFEHVREVRTTNFLTVLNNFVASNPQENGYFISDEKELEIVHKILWWHKSYCTSSYFQENLKTEYKILKYDSNYYYAISLLSFLCESDRKGHFKYEKYETIYVSKYVAKYEGQLTEYGNVCYKLAYNCNIYLANFYSKFKKEKFKCEVDDHKYYAQNYKKVLDKQTKDD